MKVSFFFYFITAASIKPHIPKIIKCDTTMALTETVGAKFSQLPYGENVDPHIRLLPDLLLSMGPSGDIPLTQNVNKIWY